jgi:hypothetical protein
MLVIETDTPKEGCAYSIWKVMITHLDLVEIYAVLADTGSKMVVMDVFRSSEQ